MRTGKGWKSITRGQVLVNPAMLKNKSPADTDLSGKRFSLGENGPKGMLSRFPNSISSDDGLVTVAGDSKSC